MDVPDDFTKFPDEYTYAGTRYVMIAKSSTSTLPRSDSDWGEAVQVKTRHENRYCSCEYCEGHPSEAPLAEKDRYWMTYPRISWMPVLENHPRKLYALMNSLGKAS